MEIDTSGNGVMHKTWLQVKTKHSRRGAKTSPKIRVELGFILKSKLVVDTTSNAQVQLAQDSDEEDPNADLTASSNDTASAFGFKRGACKLADCDCDTYQAESQKGGPCQNCGHWPAQHKNLGKEGESKDPEPPKETPKEPNDEDMFSQSSWQIDPTELEFSKLLGEGTSAQVFRGIYRAQEVAIKVLKSEKTDAKVLLEFKKEFEIMRLVFLKTKNNFSLY
jgi:hypothetical protein